MRKNVLGTEKFSGKNTLVVVFPPRIKRRLRRYAAHNNISMNEYVRRATRAYMQKEEE